MVEFAAEVGLILDPWQKRVLDRALVERADHKWAALEVGLIVPRQNGKNGSLEARQLAGLFLFGERLQTHTAHRADAVLEQFLRMKPLCELASEAIGDRKLKLRKINQSHGQESIELMSGARLNFKARSKESGRAFSGDTVFLDEAMRLQDLASLIPTLSAQPNPQIWYSSSSPLPKVESDHLRKVCKRGRQAARGKRRESRLAYLEWCARADPGERPDVDEKSPEYKAWLRAWVAAIAEANPGLGIRLNLDFAETERGAMSHEEFIRERLGIYPEDIEVSDPVIDEESWRACEAPVSSALDPVALAFEVSMDRRWACIAAAGRSDQGGTHVEIIDNRKGTRWVVDRLIELRDRHKPSVIVCHANGPAGALLPECERKELKVGVPEGEKHRPVTTTDYGRACGAAFDAVVDRQEWRHLGQPELNTAVTGASKRTMGDTWVFDRRGTTDISPLVAVTLAAWAAGLPIDEPKPSVYEERGLVTV